MKILKLTFVMLCSVSAALAEDGPSDYFNPKWKNKIIATVAYDPNFSRDRRILGEDPDTVRRNLRTYAINPEGYISGRDLLTILHPLLDGLQNVREQFGEIDQVTQEQLFTAPLRTGLRQAMGVLILNRVIDHEAMKMMIEPEVNRHRVSYAMNTIFTKNAIETKKVETVLEPLRDATGAQRFSEDGRLMVRRVWGPQSTILSHETMYGWLKERVQASSVTFEIDWRYRDGGLALALSNLRREDGHVWPAIALTFEHLPETWRAFEENIRQRLQVKYRALMRRAVWEHLVRQRRPGYQREVRFCSLSQLRKYYDTVKEQIFVEQSMSARLLEIEISGRQSGVFAQQFQKAMEEASAGVMRDLLGDTPILHHSESEREALEVSLDDIRQRLPLETLNRLQAAWTLEGLSISYGRREIELLSGDALPQDRSIASQIKRTVFSPYFSQIDPLPALTVTEGSGDNVLHHFIFLEMLTQSPVRYRDIEHKDVQHQLSQICQNKNRGMIFREVALDIFEQHHLRVQFDTDSDPNWPALDIVPDELVDYLFPRVLFPDDSEQPSLGRYLPPSRVMEVSISALEHAFKVPNGIAPNIE